MAREDKHQPILLRREWGVFPIGPNGLGSDEADGFLKAAERAARSLRLPEGAVLNRVVGGLKAGQVCGVLSREGRTLEILPKIDGTSSESRLALVGMLSVANDLRVSDGEMAFLHTQRRDLLELLIVLFARRLTRAIKGGLQRQYVGMNDELPYLRGTLDVVQQLSRRPVAPARLFCRFDELSENTPLNRLLKATVVRLLHVSKSAETQSRLEAIADTFRDVAISQAPLKERIQNDRSMGAFANLVPLARLLLRGDWQDTTTGGTAGTALLFPMNDLFERYLTRRAQQTLGRKNVHAQHLRHHALTNKLFRMIPDMVIECEGHPVIVDTKWKELDGRDTQRVGVKQSDVYQMLAYGHAYAIDGARPRLVLLYPHHQALEASEGVLRRWSASGSNIPLTIATVDVSKRRTPDQWKEFFAEIAPTPVALVS